MPGAIDGYSSSIVYKLSSLRYIFLYQVWLFTRPNFSRKFIQRADVLHTLCFPACLPEICLKCVEGQCRNFFPGLLCMHEFFSLNFLCMNVFGTSPPPPHNFSYGSSLSTFNNIFGEPGGGQLGQEKRRRKFSLRTRRRVPGMLLLTNKFHDSFECFSVIGHTK